MRCRRGAILTRAAADAQKWAAAARRAGRLESHEIAKTVSTVLTPDSAAGKYAFPGGKGEQEGLCRSRPLPGGAITRTKARQPVKQQLAKGGFRLAQILRDSFK